MRAILVAHHAGKPTKAVTLNGSKLQKIKMSADSQFYIRTEEDNFAPENITLKRDGNDLYLLLEGDEKPSLLIKDYYLYPQAQLLGMAEDHQLYAYQLTQGGDENGLLAQGETAPCALGGPALGAGDEIFAGQDDSNGAILPWLFGVLGLGAATTGVLAIRNHNKKNDHHETPSVVEQNPPPEKPVMHGVTDNVGTLQGVLPNGGATDDTTPTFSGKGQPDCTINIIIDGQIVGSTKVDAEGNWSWTPEQPLGEGHHQVVTTQTDASGQTSPASPTYDFDVDTQAPGKPSVSEITDNVGDVTGPLHNGDATDDTQPELKGQGEPGSTVTVKDGDTVLGTTIVDDNGNWRFTPDQPLSEGDHSLTVEITDSAGNTSEPSEPIHIVVDTTAPDAGRLGIEEVYDDAGPVTGPLKNGDRTDDSTPRISGTGTAGDTVVVYSDNNGENREIGRAVVDASGHWSLTPQTPLPGGRNELTVVEIDPAGNATAPGGNWVVNVDTGRPAAPVIQQVTDDVGSRQGVLQPGAVTDDSTPTVSGTAEPGAIVKVYDNGQLLGSVKADGSGNWSFTPAAPLGEGSHSLTATATNDVGQVSDETGSFSLQVDTTAPSVAEGVVAMDDVGAVKGPIGNGGTTDDSQPTLSGGAEKDSVVTIYDGDQILGSVKADSSGNWSFTPAAPLKDGNHSLSTTVTDGAGNVGGHSPALDITVDTSAVIVSISTVYDDRGTVTGNVMPDGVTDDSRPAISGRGQPGSTVTVYDKGQPLGSVKVDSEGNWSFTPVTDLGQGSHEITVKATNSAGNDSELSPPFRFTVDTAAPAAPVIDRAEDKVGSVQGSVPNRGMTDDPAAELKGSAEPGALVKIYDGGQLLGSVRTDAEGNWTFKTSDLNEGEHIFTATATDAAGNESPRSGSFILTTDYTAPDQTIMIAGIEDNVGELKGKVAHQGYTDDTTPDLYGTLSAPLRQGEIVQIWCNGVLLGTAAVSANNEWRFSVVHALKDGDYKFEARIVDSVGNQSAPSNSYEIHVDTVAPVSRPTIDSVVDDQEAIVGNVANHGSTNDRTPTLNGHGAENNGLVFIYDNGNLIGSVRADGEGNWSFTAPANSLNDAAHTLTAKNADEAGNIGPASNDWNIVVDTQAPQIKVSITDLIDDVGPLQGTVNTTGYTDDTSPTLIFGLSASMSEGERIEVSRDGVTVGYASWKNGRWEFTDSELSDGQHTYHARVVDSAGNVGEWSGDYVINLMTGVPVAKSKITGISDDTGVSDSDFITSDKTLTIHGELDQALKADERAQISYDNGKSWIDVDVIDGKWSWNDSRVLTDQNWVWLTRVVNIAGNASEVWSQTVTVDTVSPTNNTTLLLDSADDNGSSNTDNITSVITPTVFGKVSAGSDQALDKLHVVLFDDKNDNGRLDADDIILADNVTVAADGSWSHDIYSLRDGTYRVKAAVADEAGNISSNINSLKNGAGVYAPLVIDHNQSNVVKGNASSQLGWFVSTAGDFNGDGIEDFMVSAQYGDTAGRQNNGATYLLYGSANGLADLNTISELTPQQGFRIDGANNNDRMGFIVNKLGDFNGDGIDDVVIASHWNDRIYVLYGGRDRYDGSFDLKAIENGDTSNGFVIRNANNQDSWNGFSAVGGDINGDGIADLIYGNREGGVAGRGQATVIYGQQGGYSNITLNYTNNAWRLPTDVHGTVIMAQDQNANANDPSKVWGQDLGEGIGIVGDVNGDGIDDFVIADPRSTNHLSAGNGGSAGTSYLIYGSKAGLPSQLDLNNLTPEQGIRIQSLHYEWTGGADGNTSQNTITALGDINGDGIDDFALAAPYSDPGDPGRVYVIYGKKGGYGDRSLNLDVFPNTSMSLPNGYTPTFTQEDGFLLVNEKSTVTQQNSATEWFGGSIRGAGDINGDGIDDFIIGARYADGNGMTDNGAIYVVYGKDHDWGVNDVNGKPIFSIKDIIADPSQGYVLRGTSNDAWLGNSVALGDWNGDGIADVAVGQPGSNDNAAGQYSVYYSTPEFTQVFTTGNDKLHGTTGQDFLLGGDGDDIIDGIGYKDIAMGGTGNDVIKIVSSDFMNVSGGAGIDTLALEGQGIVLDLYAKRGVISGFEKFDLASGHNTLKIQIGDVMRMGETDLILKDGKKQLLIDGVNGQVELVMPGVDAGSWVKGNDISHEGNTYHTYTVGNSIEVLIDSRIEPIM